MKMLRITAPAKAIMVLKFAILNIANFVVLHDNRDKGVGF